MPAVCHVRGDTVMRLFFDIASYSAFCQRGSIEIVARGGKERWSDLTGGDRAVRALFSLGDLVNLLS